MVTQKLSEKAYKNKIKYISEYNKMRRATGREMTFNMTGTAEVINEIKERLVNIDGASNAAKVLNALRQLQAAEE